MKVIQCPEVYKQSHSNPHEITVFLGGGISNCGNWQKEMIARFNDVDELVLLNPRREDFDIANPNMSIDQIKWEYDHLKKASAILFWFPYETMCPITLYELGVWAAKGAKIFVGCHPAYQRKLDVEVQLQLLRPDVKVHDNFGTMVEEIKQWIALQNDCTT